METLDLPVRAALPTEAFSFEGLPFDPTSAEWTLRDTATEFDVCWPKVETKMTPSTLLGLKLTLLWYVENRSVSRVRNIFIGIEHLLRSLGFDASNRLEEISETTLLNYLAKLGESREHRLGSLSSVFERWSDQGYAGIDASAIRWLNETRLKGNPKGVAVTTQNPLRGPFTQIEALAIQQAVTEALANGRMSLGDHCLVTLISALGSRGVQIAALKCMDLKDPTAEDSRGEHWVLMVPRSKQRLQQARAELKPRELIPELAQLLCAQITDVQHTYRELGLTGLDPDQLPLFPDWHASAPPGFAHHSTGKDVSELLRAATATIDAISERTGERIHITARRFRYTVGTRAAEEGHSELTIAELLDHSDIQQVAIYVMATQTIVERISKAMALHLAPIAQAFLGEIVKDESEAKRGGDPSSRIKNPDNLENLGNCGRFGFCSESAPIACYTCRRFQAWADAPHEQLLDRLLLERERIKGITKDLRIASVNDRTILAIAQVVQKCRRLLQRLLK
jgi:integrase